MAVLDAAGLFVCGVQVVGTERRCSRDSDSDDDVADELRADFVDEHTGDVPSPHKRYSVPFSANFTNKSRRLVYSSHSHSSSSSHCYCSYSFNSCSLVMRPCN